MITSQRAGNAGPVGLIILFAVLFTVTVPSTLASDRTGWEELLYPDEELRQMMVIYRDSTLTDALSTAVDWLRDMGAEAPLICRVTRIEAPLGGWLIDGIAALELDGTDYGSFRLGISDDCELFCTIALGQDRYGRSVWFPEPGPDHQVSEGEPFPDGLLEYEFLIDRESFESLEENFPRQSSSGGGASGNAG